jgi:hypothetical protein
MSGLNSAQAGEACFALVESMRIHCSKKKKDKIFFQIRDRIFGFVRCA